MTLPQVHVLNLASKLRIHAMGKSASSQPAVTVNNPVLSGIWQFFGFSKFRFKMLQTTQSSQCLNEKVETLHMPLKSTLKWNFQI
jgi:hypothetical protein